MAAAPAEVVAAAPAAPAALMDAARDARAPADDLRKVPDGWRSSRVLALMGVFSG